MHLPVIILRTEHNAISQSRTVAPYQADNRAHHMLRLVHEHWHL